MRDEPTQDFTVRLCLDCFYVNTSFHANNDLSDCFSKQ